jgi:hypothetical protein
MAEFLKIGSKLFAAEAVHAVIDSGGDTVTVEFVRGASETAHGEDARAILAWAEMHLVSAPERATSTPHRVKTAKGE